jgi:hypothetical protein
MNQRDEDYRAAHLARIRAKEAKRLEGVRAMQAQTQAKRKAGEVTNGKDTRTARG